MEQVNGNENKPILEIFNHEKIEMDENPNQEKSYIKPQV
jgi:hypothetical protein